MLTFYANPQVQLRRVLHNITARNVSALFSFFCFWSLFVLAAIALFAYTRLPLLFGRPGAQTATSNGEEQLYKYDLWDAKKMRSCWCNRTSSVDNSFSGTSNTYRGPYSLADTDSYGYDCGLGRLAPSQHSQHRKRVQRLFLQSPRSLLDALPFHDHPASLPAAAMSYE